VKILYLAPGVFDKSGISRYSRFQICALREAFGDENIAVASLMGRQHGDFEEYFDVAFAGAMPLGRASRAIFVIAAMDVVRRCRPDVVICAHVNMGPLAYGLASISRSRFVQNIYGLELWIEGGLPRLRREALRRANVVISDCHNTADKAIELGLINSRPEIVWDCADTNKFKPTETNWKVLEKYGLRKGDRFKVLFLGRIAVGARHKGYERLLRVLSSLPAVRFELIIAGKGDDLENVREMVHSLGIADRTTITGAIHEADMPDIYRCADAFYLVSEVGPGKGEGIPLTPIEAMSCGVPILAGNQDGSRELLDNGGGWCGEPEDLKGQCSYIESLEADKEFHKREKAIARKRAVSTFGYARFAKETVEAVEKALATRHGKRHF
jgi:phosphatidyl-myo-inositol dimannoside synthase